MLAAGLLIWLALACSRETTAGQKPAEQAKRVANMPMIELKIVPVRSEVLSGESLEVEVTLTNTGADPVEVRSPDEESAFTYFLKRENESDPAYMLSVSDWQTARWGTPPKPMDMEASTAAPGVELLYEEDLAIYAGEPVAPGKYHLSVVYEHESGTARSPEVPFLVATPNVHGSLLAPAAGPTEGRLGVVFVHENADGSAALFQRESPTGSPANGVRYRRVEFKQADSVTGLALATELAENRGIRWFAWLEGAGLTASLAQGESGFGTIGPVALKLEDPDLFRHGWQITEEEAVFFALGRNADGGITAASVTFEAGKDGTVQRTAIGATAMPEFWAARLLPGTDPQAFALVWAEPGETNRIYQQTVTPGEAAGSAPELLAELDAPLVALALDPVGAREAAALDILTGPVGDEREMTWRRLPLVAGGGTTEWKFTCPVSETGEVPGAWAIPHAVVPRPLALATLGENLLVCAVTENSVSRAIAGPVPRIRALRLELVRGNLLAMWVDGEAGLSLRAIANRQDLGITGGD